MKPANSDLVLGHDTPWSQVLSLLGPAYLETWIMVGVGMTLTVLIGGALGIVLFNSSARGLFAHRRTNLIVGWIVDMGRSLPFLVLMERSSDYYFTVRALQKDVIYLDWHMGTLASLFAAATTRPGAK